MSGEAKAYEGWAIVELMGHIRMAGRVSEAPMYGTALLRVDIPEGDGYTTQLVSGASLFRLTPCSEEVARLISGGGQPAPIEPWEIKRLEAPRGGLHPILEEHDEAQRRAEESDDDGEDGIE